MNIHFGVKLLALLTVSVVVQAKELKVPQIQDMVTLPVSGVKAVKSNDQILFVSSNGRFVFTGELYDTWYKRKASSMDELRDTGTHIHLDRMNLNVDELNTATLGKGKKDVVVFIDPRCPYCEKIINASYKLLDQYTFKYVIVQVLGEESERLARVTSCASDRKEIIPALLSRSIDELATKPSCTEADSFLKSNLTAEMFGIRGVPYSIAPNGKVNKGLPANLAQWLNANH